MKQVKIRHPKVGEAAVPESSVPHWRSRGWELVDEHAESKSRPRRDSGGKDS
jgi:hypothetical protein